MRPQGQISVDLGGWWQHHLFDLGRESSAIDRTHAGGDRHGVHGVGEDFDLVGFDWRRVR